jgi:hypothetical protein
MSMKLQKAFASGRVRVRNNTAGQVMVQIYRPDPAKPGRVRLDPILVGPTAEKDLTKEATVEELKRSPNLDRMCSAPHNVLEPLV